MQIRDLQVRENVGSADRLMRSILGPTLLAVGYTALDGRRGLPLGVTAMAAGAIITGTAITRYCPINAALGIDTRH